MARVRALGPDVRGLRSGGDRAAGGAALGRVRDTHRGGAGARPPRRPGLGAGGRRRRAAAARAPARAADARALPLRPPGGRARGLPRGAAHARRGGRRRAGRRAARPPGRDPRAGPGARPARGRGAAGAARGRFAAAGGPPARAGRAELPAGRRGRGTRRRRGRLWPARHRQDTAGRRTCPRGAAPPHDGALRGNVDRRPPTRLPPSGERRRADALHCSCWTTPNAPEPTCSSAPPMPLQGRRAARFCCSSCTRGRSRPSRSGRRCRSSWARSEARPSPTSRSCTCRRALFRPSCGRLPPRRAASRSRSTAPRPRRPAPRPRASPRRAPGARLPSAASCAPPRPTCRAICSRFVRSTNAGGSTAASSTTRRSRPSVHTSAWRASTPHTPITSSAASGSWRRWSPGLWAPPCWLSSDPPGPASPPPSARDCCRPWPAACSPAPSARCRL